MAFAEARQVAKLLREYAQRTALRGGNPYRAKAYSRAADSLAALAIPLNRLIEEDRLTEIPGVGEAIADIITKLHLALESRRDCTDDAGSYAVLEIKYVFKRAIEMIRPEMHAIFSIDELTCDAHARSGLTHAAFQHVADAEIATNLFNVHGPAFVSEA